MVMSAKEKRARFMNINVRYADDGVSLHHPDHERVALRVAEGVSFFDAWAEIGKKHQTQDQKRYRNLLLTHDIFKARVKAIMDERAAAIAQDEIFGETLFMINQLYREARANSDRALMHKAVSMRLEVAKNIASRKGAPPLAAPPEPEVDEDAGEASEVKRPVGRPAIEDPQAANSLNNLRSRLVGKGVPVPERKVAVQ